MREGRRILRMVTRDGVEQAAAKVSECEVLLKTVCEVLEEYCRSQAVLKVCENETGEASGADSLSER